MVVFEEDFFSSPLVAYATPARKKKQIRSDILLTIFKNCFDEYDKITKIFDEGCYLSNFFRGRFTSREVTLFSISCLFHYYLLCERIAFTSNGYKIITPFKARGL